MAADALRGGEGAFPSVSCTALPPGVSAEACLCIHLGQPWFLPSLDRSRLGSSASIHGAQLGKDTGPQTGAREIKNIVDPEDPRCARLTLTGQMIAVSPEEVEFAKQAMFSRHPVMRKWPRQYEWFFMKMKIEHIWLQKWYGGATDISREEYFKAVPRKA